MHAFTETKMLFLRPNGTCGFISLFPSLSFFSLLIPIHYTDVLWSEYTVSIFTFCTVYTHAHYDPRHFDLTSDM